MSEHVAGFALDTLVAEKVMGFRDDWDGMPNYSTDIRAAWEVLKKILAAPEHPSIELNVGLESTTVLIDHMEDWFVRADAATAPLAVCLAALEWTANRR